MTTTDEGINVRRPEGMTGDAFVAYVLQLLGRRHLSADEWMWEMRAWFALFTPEELDDELPSWRRMRAEKLALAGNPTLAQTLM